MKFDDSKFTREVGGFVPKSKSAMAMAANGQSVVRKTLTDAKKLAEQLPYYHDPWSGHMIVAGELTSSVSYLMIVAYRACCVSRIRTPSAVQHKHSAFLAGNTTHWTNE